MRFRSLLLPGAVSLLAIAACSSDDNTDAGAATVASSSVTASSSSVTASTSSSSTASSSSSSSSSSSASSSSSSMGGAGGAGGATSSSGGSGGLPPVTHPQVVNPNGGPVLTAPKVQLIAYASDPMANDTQAMIQEFAGESAWGAQTSEYGVGALTVLPPIMLTEAAPASFNDNGNAFTDRLTMNITGANPAWGAADASTVYVFLMPAGTDVKSGGSCCTDYLGYHWEDQIANNQSVSYAIICDCGADADYPDLSALDWVTTTVNHEIVEGATDPYPSSLPAFADVDAADEIWAEATGGEVADMCDDNSDTNILPAGATYKIQRSWSNAAAAAGKNPCVPVPDSETDPFFNAYPALTDTVAVYGENAEGVIVPVGQTKNVDVQLVSDGPTSGPWQITAYDLDDFSGYPAQNMVTLDQTSGSNGDVLHLSITATGSSSAFGTAGFVLVSDLNGQENISFGAIGN